MILVEAGVIGAADTVAVLVPKWDRREVVATTASQILGA
jgi:hypothetical protein